MQDDYNTEFLAEENRQPGQARSLKGFFQSNLQQTMREDIMISDRFPEPFTIRPLSDAEYAKLKELSYEVKQKSCNRSQRRRGQQAEVEFHTDRLHAAVCAAGTVFPDLNDRELQDDWGVTSAEELVGYMLLAAEGEDLYNAIMELSGFVDDVTMTQEAKN
jgi:hypothetical protein